MKRPWQSKTLWVNSLVALGALLIPGAAEYIKDNPDVSVAVHAVVNIILRLVTKETIDVKPPIAVGLLLLLVGCSSMQQVLDPKLFYKRDIEIKINNKAYEGVTVVPFANSYKIGLKPKGEIDLLLLRTCHREYTGEKLSQGGFFTPGKDFYYDYVPVRGIEDSRVCPMRVDAYESEKGRNSWAFLDFENPGYTIQAKLDCNGNTVSVNGVGVCQAKEQTVQRIQFNEPIRFAPPMPEKCSAPKRNGAWYEINTVLGECLYLFDTQDARMGRFTLIGYGGVLIRSAQ